MNSQEKIPNLLSDFLQNPMMDYLKFVLYGTQDKKNIEEQETALRDLMLGMHEMSRKNLETASGFIGRAMNLFSERKDDLSVAFSEFFMAEIFRMQDDLKQAQDYYQKAYDIFSARKNLMAYTVEEKIKEVKSEKEKKS